MDHNARDRYKYSKPWRVSLDREHRKTKETIRSKETRVDMKRSTSLAVLLVLFAAKAHGKDSIVS